jgi:hypothetical protein
MARPASRRTVRARRPTVDPDDASAVEALAARVVGDGPRQRLRELVEADEAAQRGDRSLLSAEAQRRAARFTRDSVTFARKVQSEVLEWNDRWAPVADMALPTARDLLHVFGPNPEGSTSQWKYRLQWAEIDGGPGTGIDARVDLGKGTFVASHFSTSGERNSYAGLGVRFTPLLASCRLSIRPHVQWSGFDILQHRVFDPQLNEQRWARAVARIGLVVQSTKLDGSDPLTEVELWPEAWSRAEINPSGMRDYSGVTGSATGLAAEVTAVSTRRYSVWLCCMATVVADPGFAVSTRASCSISCSSPFLVVEEIPY